MNQILINILTRKFQRSVRLPEGDVPGNKGAGLSKSAASRHFVALLAAPLKEWMASDLSSLNLLVIQIDGIRMDKDMTLVAAVGVDSTGDKHPLGALEGATENAVTVHEFGWKKWSLTDRIILRFEGLRWNDDRKGFTIPSFARRRSSRCKQPACRWRKQQSSCRYRKAVWTTGCAPLVRGTLRPSVRGSAFQRIMSMS
jgi:hypothetical protein